MQGNIALLRDSLANGVKATVEFLSRTQRSIGNGKTIYWAMAPLDTPRTIYYSSIQNDGLWSQPKVIRFTLSEDGDCHVLSYDGKKMYFNSNRPNDEGGIKRERIWCVDFVDGEWGNPYPLGNEINGQHLHWQISIDMSGMGIFNRI